MESVGQEVDKNRIDYAQLAEGVDEPRIRDADRAVLEPFLDNYRFADDQLHSLDGHFQEAIRPLPRGGGAFSEEALKTKNERRIFFEEAQMEQPAHRLFGALQAAKKRNKGTYLSPHNFIRNGRLLLALGADIQSTFAHNDKFLTAAIDLAKLEEVEECLRPYDLSLEQCPPLLLHNPDTLPGALAALTEN